MTLSKVGPVVAAALLFGTVAGCGLLSDSGDESNANGDSSKADSGASGDKPSADQKCGGPDFPCTWEKVPKKVVTRMGDVAGEAIGWAKAGRPPEEIAKKLEEAGDVVVLGYSEDSIRYRVTGGRPAWVFLMTAGSFPPTIGGALSMRTPTASPWMGPATGEAKSPVAPWEKGTRPTKKALVLSPFRWQWQLWGTDDNGKIQMDDEVEDIKGMLEEVEDYGGRVELKQNTWTGKTIAFGMGSSDFASWKDYDVIHVSTHGTSCDKPTKSCLTSLATGELWPEDLLAPPEGVSPEQDPDNDLKQQLKDELSAGGFDMGFIPIAGVNADEMDAVPGLRVVVEPTITNEAVEKAKKEAEAKKDGDKDDKKMASLEKTVYFAGPFVLVNSEFFSQQYGSGLDDKIIFLSACKSGTKPDLLKALGGRATAVIGWDKVMKLKTATVAAQKFWRLMTEPAKATTDDTESSDVPFGANRVQGAFDEMEKVADNSGVLGKGGGPTKSIVIEGSITEDDLTGAKLDKSGDVTTRAQEIIRLLRSDGETLLNDGGWVEMIGAPGDGEHDKLSLYAQVMGIADDDKPGDYVIHVDVDGREAKGTFKPTEKMRPGVWRGHAEVELGFDLSGRPFKLEPWVEMPKGGKSRWYYEDISAQYFYITLTGAAFGTPQTFSIPVSKVKLDLHDGGFVSMFQDHFERNAVSKDTTSLSYMIGGVSGSGFGVGSFDFGPESTGADGWSMRVWLQAEGCPHNYAGCKNLNLRPVSGTLDVTKFRLGKGITRPHLKGPTYMTATFKATYRVSAGDREGETYMLKGGISMLD